MGQVARVARLARQLGFRVLALIDGDGKGDGETVTAIEQECDVVIRLPPGVAVEAAIVRGIDPQVLRSAAATLTEWGIPDPTIDVDDAEVADALVRPLHNHGLHEPLLEALIPDTGIPPVLGAALDALRDAADPTLESPRLVVLDVDREATGPAGAR